MPRIYYLTKINFNSNKANVYNTVKTCEVLSLNNNAMVVLISTDNSLVNEEAKDFFFKKNSIKNKFDIVSMGSFANYFKNSNIRPINWIETILANLSLAWFVISSRKKFDIFYFRDPFIFLPVLIVRFVFKNPIFFEIHAVLRSKHGQFLNKFLAKHSDVLIVITRALKEYYEKINKNVIVSFCACAEQERFDVVKKKKGELRKELNLPEEKIILGYTGNLWKTGNFDSYGIEYIINAIPLLDKNVIFVGVGKKRNETEGLEDLAKNLNLGNRVLFLPWLPKNEIAKYILAFDILLIPSAGAQIGNSPTKMFEYMVSGRPIIAANTKAISEVLHNKKNSLLVDYKNPKSWVEAISKVLLSKVLLESLIQNAKDDAKKYTWGNRGLDIFNFVKKIIDEKNFK